MAPAAPSHKETRRCQDPDATEPRQPETAMKLASLLKRRQRELRMSTYQLARHLRISFVAVQRVLAASSQPNVRTAGKYARFLGLSLEKLERMMRPRATRGRSAKPRRAAAPRAKRRSGRA